jgi:hypothetical protein
VPHDVAQEAREPAGGPGGGRWTAGGGSGGGGPEHTEMAPTEMAGDSIGGDWRTTKILSVVDTRAKEEQGDRWVRISGTGDARQCDRCGRMHEIHATVQDEHGVQHTVGVGCMRASGPTEARAKSALSASRTVDQITSELEKTRDYNARRAAARAEVAKLPYPGHDVVADPTFTTDRRDGVMTVPRDPDGRDQHRQLISQKAIAEERAKPYGGDAQRWEEENARTLKEMNESTEDAWRDKETDKRVPKDSRHEYVDMQGLEARLKKAQKKLATLLDKPEEPKAEATTMGDANAIPDLASWYKDYNATPAFVNWVKANSEPAPTMYRGEYGYEGDLDLDGVTRNIMERGRDFPTPTAGWEGVVSFSSDRGVGSDFADSGDQGLLFVVDGLSAARMPDFVPEGSNGSEKEWLVARPQHVVFDRYKDEPGLRTFYGHVEHQEATTMGHVLNIPEHLKTMHHDVGLSLLPPGTDLTQLHTRLHAEKELAHSHPRPEATTMAPEGSTILYHLTDHARFKLDPKKVPEDAAFAIRSREDPGLYVTDDPERWINGYNYVRPFVVELSVPKDAVHPERWGGEQFIPAENYDKVKILRVIPLDAYAREEYGEPGWVEEYEGKEFDTGRPISESRGQPFEGYHYTGPDVRDMPLAEINRQKHRVNRYLHEVRPQVFSSGEATTMAPALSPPSTANFATAPALARLHHLMAAHHQTYNDVRTLDQSTHGGREHATLMHDLLHRVGAPPNHTHEEVAEPDFFGKPTLVMHKDAPGPDLTGIRSAVKEFEQALAEYEDAIGHRITKAYDPNEERGYHGRWATSGSPAGQEGGEKEHQAHHLKQKLASAAIALLSLAPSVTLLTSAHGAEIERISDSLRKAEEVAQIVGVPAESTTMGSVGQGRKEDWIPQAIEQAKVFGGSTFSPMTGLTPTEGFQVGGLVEPEKFSQAVLGDTAKTTEAIHGMIKAHSQLFEGHPEMYVGMWTHGGQLWLEPSEQVMDRDKAITLGKKRNQIEVYDNAGQVSLPIEGGTGEYVQKDAPGFAFRLFRLGRSQAEGVDREGDGPGCTRVGRGRDTVVGAGGRGLIPIVAFAKQGEGEWDPNKHPRGQPQNAGEFASSPGGGETKLTEPVTRPLTQPVQPAPTHPVIAALNAGADTDAMSQQFSRDPMWRRLKQTFHNWGSTNAKTQQHQQAMLAEIIPQAPPSQSTLYRGLDLSNKPLGQDASLYQNRDQIINAQPGDSLQLPYGSWSDDPGWAALFEGSPSKDSVQLEASGMPAVNFGNTFGDETEWVSGGRVEVTGRSVDENGVTHLAVKSVPASAPGASSTPLAKPVEKPAAPLIQPVETDAEREARYAAQAHRDEPEDYHLMHTAPGFTDDGSTARMDSLDTLVPADIYDPMVQRQYYGGGEGDPDSERSDSESFDAINRVRGRPGRIVRVYRGVPKDVTKINPGDWVTPSRHYARWHVKSNLGYNDAEGKWVSQGHVISKLVPARELWWDANSINEFGWDPEGGKKAEPTGMATLSRPEQRLWGDRHEGSEAITAASARLLNLRPLQEVEAPKGFDTGGVDLGDDEHMNKIAQAMLDEIHNAGPGHSKLFAGQSLDAQRLARFKVGQTVTLPLTATFDADWSDDMAEELGEKPKTPLQWAQGFARGETNWGKSKLAGGIPTLLEFGTATPRFDYGAHYNTDYQEPEDANEPGEPGADSGERITAGNFKVTSVGRHVEKERDEEGYETGNETEYRVIRLTPVKTPKKKSEETTMAPTQPLLPIEFPKPSPVVGKTMQELKAGDRIWASDEDQGSNLVPQTVTRVSPSSQPGWTRVETDQPQKWSPSGHLIFEAQNDSDARIVGGYAKEPWSQNSKVLPQWYVDSPIPGNNIIGGTDPAAEKWRRGLGMADQRLLDFWERSFDNVKALRQNPTDSAAQHLDQLIETAPKVKGPVFRGVLGVPASKMTEGQHFSLTVPVSGSTDLPTAAGFGFFPGIDQDRMVLQLDDADAHTIGNNMDEAVVMPGRYEVTAVEKKAIAPDLTSMFWGGKKGDKPVDYDVVHVKWLGAAKRGSGHYGTPHFSRKSKVDIQRFVGEPGDFDFEDPVAKRLLSAVMGPFAKLRDVSQEQRLPAGDPHGGRWTAGGGGGGRPRADITVPAGAELVNRAGQQVKDGTYTDEYSQGDYVKPGAQVVDRGTSESGRHVTVVGGDANTVLVRGVPIAWNDPRIPDTLYHVSPKARQIEQEGVIDARGAGGLGGDKSDKIVSMTVDKPMAENLRDSMLAMIRAAKATQSMREGVPLGDIGGDPAMDFNQKTKKWEPSREAYGRKIVNSFRQSAKDEGWEWNPEKDNPNGFTVMADTYGLGDWSNIYFNARRTATGKADPIFFGVDANKWASYDPDDLGIVEVPKKALDNGAMTTNFDLDKHGLGEVRSYGDVILPPEATQDEATKIYPGSVADERRQVAINSRRTKAMADAAPRDNPPTTWGELRPGDILQSDDGLYGTVDNATEHEGNLEGTPGGYMAVVLRRPNGSAQRLFMAKTTKLSESSPHATTYVTTEQEPPHFPGITNEIRRNYPAAARQMDIGFELAQKHCPPHTFDGVQVRLVHDENGGLIAKYNHEPGYLYQPDRQLAVADMMEPEHADASFSRAVPTVSFNEHWLMDLEAMENKYKITVDTNFHTPHDGYGSITTCLVHELGHHLDHEGPSAATSHQRINDLLLSIPGVKTYKGVTSAPSHQPVITDAWKSEHIGSYSEDSPGEMLADAWAEYVTATRPRTPAKVIGGVLSGHDAEAVKVVAPEPAKRDASGHLISRVRGEELAKALALLPIALPFAPGPFAKFDPSQLRDPAGTPTGGRWTSATGAGGTAPGPGQGAHGARNGPLPRLVPIDVRTVAQPTARLVEATQMTPTPATTAQAPAGPAAAPKAAAPAVFHYLIPEHRMGEFQAGVDKVSRKAQKLGLKALSVKETGTVPATVYRITAKAAVPGGDLVPSSLVTYHYQPEDERSKQDRKAWREELEEGTKYYEGGTQTITKLGATTLHQVEVTGEEPHVEGWTFVAAIDHEPGERNIVSAVPGGAAPEGLTKEYTNALPNCEHCGLARNRSKTYLLQDAKGKIKQVGSSCLGDFFPGHAADQMARLAELYVTLDAFAGGEGDDYESSGSSARFGGWLRDDVMAHAAAAVRTKGWTSKGAAQKYNEVVEQSGGGRHKQSTADDVVDSLTWRPTRTEPTQPFDITDEDREKGHKVVEWVEGLNPSSSDDYLWNMQSAVSRQVTQPRHLGLAVSAIGAYDREQSQIAQRAREAERMVPVIEGRHAMTGTVLSTKVQESDFGRTWKMLVRVETPEGEYKVWGSIPSELQQGWSQTGEVEPAHPATDSLTGYVQHNHERTRDGQLAGGTFHAHADFAEGHTHKGTDKVFEGFAMPETDVYGPAQVRMVPEQPVTAHHEQVKQGDRVTFTATVEKSRDDDSFGFFTRPTKAKRLAEGEEPEPEKPKRTRKPKTEATTMGPESEAPKFHPGQHIVDYRGSRPGVIVNEVQPDRFGRRYSILHDDGTRSTIREYELEIGNTPGKPS